MLNRASTRDSSFFMRLLGLSTVISSAMSRADAPQLYYGYESTNQQAHYYLDIKITSVPGYDFAAHHRAEFEKNFLNIGCDVLYDSARQNEYQHSLQIPWVNMSKWDSLNYNVEVFKVALQPRLPVVEECLVRFVNHTFSGYEIEVAAFIEQKRSERRAEAAEAERKLAEAIRAKLPYVARAISSVVGFFAANRVVNHIQAMDRPLPLRRG